MSRFTSAWLGRDPANGATVLQPTLDGLSPDRLAQITASPRHYGFHATLKPPFRLANGADETDLVSALACFVQETKSFLAPPLQLDVLGGFLALTPSAMCSALDQLAAECVEAFDGFRAPPADHELTRRRTNRLTPRQDDLLTKWGYPYVFEEFRFHMTLTGKLDDDERTKIHDILGPLVAPHCQGPLSIDAITLLRQDEANAPFKTTSRLPLFH